jgi:L-ascorbate metabolism protein UlaG (beta-lactamase superfamily)
MVQQHKVFRMTGKTLALLCIVLSATNSLSAKDAFQEDTITTASGPLVVTFIGHGTLMLQYAGRTIHIDPVGGYADYAKLPKADLVLITHHHGDHLDPSALEQIVSEKTTVIQTKLCTEKYPKGKVMANGDVRKEAGITVEAVPAYNLVHKRPDGTPFHPRGEGNGYVLTFGDTRVYIAGDTENTPEMKALKNISVAFLPMNLPYTMTPEMVADAAKAFRPGILYPYHSGKTDPGLLVSLLKHAKGIEVRIRPME